MSKYSFDLPTLVSGLWDNVKEYVPEKKKEDVAAGIIESMVKCDLCDEVKMLEEAYGIDPAIDEAINTVIEEYGEQRDEEENEVEEF